MAKPSRKSLSHLLDENRVFKPTPERFLDAHIPSLAKYKELYQRSLSDSESFWLEQAQDLEWYRFPKLAGQYVWDSAKEISHTWFEDGQLNVSINCLDRHLSTLSHKTAILWQGEGEDSRAISFGDLYREVCKFANVLKRLGIHKGDCVCLYMPMVPELAVAMLACARVGAIHSIVFGGFSAEALAYRMKDSNCKLLITADVTIRGGKAINLKEIADLALAETPFITQAVVLKRQKESCPMVQERDYWYHELMADASMDHAPEVLNAEDPLFILYTSGSTGKPKGVLHTQAGYLLHVSLSHRLIFDIHETDIYWCTADLGWITGHSYGIYGPLANGCTTMMYEGALTYPHPDRFWEIIEKHKITVFYTAPTAIRSLISYGSEWPRKHDLTSLRVLGTVGEPINPEAWMWYYQEIGNSKIPIMDTWWQTETGGIMISPMPASHSLKPGSASLPFFGVDPIILRDDGTVCRTNEGGSLCLKRPWPGMMRTTWGDHKRFIQTYFSTFPNVYFTGDGCRIDEDGDYWLLGRIDDVVNISGHRMGTAEVESALVSHPAVAEAAVVPIPHEIKGNGLCAYVILIEGQQPSPTLLTALADHVKKEISSIAIPDQIRIVTALPKTRSGKIMRRLLRKIAKKDFDNLGDISTLADPGILQELKELS